MDKLSYLILLLTFLSFSCTERNKVSIPASDSAFPPINKALAPKPPMGWYAPLWPAIKDSQAASQGLRFGIHILGGIPKKAVDAYKDGFKQAINSHAAGLFRIAEAK